MSATGNDVLGGFHHVALTVRDLDRSVAFYADVLGFVELFRENSDERRACVMRFPGGAPGVGLVQHRPGYDVPFDPTRLGLDHVAFTVDSRDGLDHWARRLTDAGVEHSGALDIPPGAILNFKDPDGIALALFWDRT
jgi:catechol 2,3-dioxygenase-like lactoylglutathione lyase family enzyme